jgi:SNF2 family DNA or RNA helicase
VLELYDHQKQSIEFFENQRRTFDASDPGTGKTRVILQLLKDRGHTALVVCPKTLMETAWVDDAAKFTPELVVLPIYAGKFRERDSKINADLSVYNTDAVNWLVKQPASFFKRYDALVIDESSTFKHRTSDRSKAIAKLVKHFEYRHGMSGTPNSNKISDIWHQIKLIDDGMRLGTSFAGFRNETMTAVPVRGMPQYVNWVDKDGAAEVVASLISDITMRHKFEECVDIPPNVTRHFEINLKHRHRQFYEKFQRDAILELGDDLVLGVNAAVVAGKLIQIASGAVYTTEDSKRPVRVFDTDRYDLVAELVEERAASIVFFQWQHQKEQLEKALKAVGVDNYAILDGNTKDKDRSGIIKQFQAGLFKVLLLHPQTGAHGITLTRATAAIWVSPTYNAEWWKQGYHRIVRAGQENMTETIMISARNTIDKKVYESMMSKTTNMNAFLSTLVLARDD